MILLGASYELYPMFSIFEISSQSNLPQPLVPLADQIVNSEAMLLSFLAEKSLPFSVTPDLLNFVKELSRDKQALNGISMHRTSSASYKL